MNQKISISIVSMERIVSLVGDYFFSNKKINKTEKGKDVRNKYLKIFIKFKLHIIYPKSVDKYCDTDGKSSIIPLKTHCKF